MKPRPSLTLLFVILLGGALPCIAQLTSLGTFGPGLSPCRQFFAYVTHGPASSDLFVRDLSTQRRTNLTENDLVESNPSWSPDSSMIAFNSLRQNGNVDVCIVDLLSGELTQVTDGNGLYLRPFWISDSEVGYTDETTALGRVMYVDLDTGAKGELLVGTLGDAGAWRPASLVQPGFVEVTRASIAPSEARVIRYFTGTISKLVEIVADDGYRYCPARERYYQDTSSSPTITWSEDRATGETGTAWTILWSGLVYLPSNQTVTFTMDHDQRIYSWVDGLELYSTASTDGRGKSIQATVSLSAGIHTIDVAYFDDYEGGGGLWVYWEADEIPWQVLRSMVVE